MKEIYQTIVRKNKKISFIILITLRLLILACMISQMLRGNWYYTFLCLLAFILLCIPVVLQKRFKIALPKTLEIIVFLFIFSGTVLGEIFNFYGHFVHWDTMMHTLNGFLCAAVGFALIDLLNKNSENIKLSPLYTALAAFCFSMTVGVMWEFFEWGMDHFFLMDMQKDSILTAVSTVMLDPLQANNPVIITGIAETVLYDAEGNTLAAIYGGFLDIGLQDTMKDLFVNFIGAVVFSIFGFFYVKTRGKFKFVTRFIPQKASDENPLQS